MPKLLQVPEVTLRVMSLNMQYGSGPKDNEGTYLDRYIPWTDVDRNLSKIVDLTCEINPDIICLQEVDFDSPRTGNFNQAYEIASRLARKGVGTFQVVTGSCLDFDEKKLGKIIRQVARRVYHDKRFAGLLKFAGFEPNRLPEGKVKIHFGNAILSRYPVREVRHEYYLESLFTPWTYLNIFRQRDERKSLLRCRINYFPEVPEKIPLYIFNTHFENKNKKKRKEQSKILVEKLSEEDLELLSKMVAEKLERRGPHRILAGDFNAVPLGWGYQLDSRKRDGSLERLLRHPNMKCFEGLHCFNPPPEYATYPSLNPRKVLDTILVSEFLEIVKYEVYQQRVSDHLAVVADVKINHDLVPKNIIKQWWNVLSKNKSESEFP